MLGSRSEPHISADRHLGEVRNQLLVLSQKLETTSLGRGCKERTLFRSLCSRVGSLASEEVVALADIRVDRNPLCAQWARQLAPGVKRDVEKRYELGHFAHVSGHHPTAVAERAHAHHIATHRTHGEDRPAYRLSRGENVLHHEHPLALDQRAVAAIENKARRRLVGIGRQDPNRSPGPQMMRRPLGENDPAHGRTHDDVHLVRVECLSQVPAQSGDLLRVWVDGVLVDVGIPVTSARVDEGPSVRTAPVSLRMREMLLVESVSTEPPTGGC